MLVFDDPVALSYVQAFFRNRSRNNDFVFAILERLQHVLLFHLCLSCSE